MKTTKYRLNRKKTQNKTKQFVTPLTNRMGNKQVMEKKICVWKVIDQSITFIVHSGILIPPNLADFRKFWSLITVLSTNEQYTECYWMLVYSISEKNLSKQCLRLYDFVIRKDIITIYTWMNTWNFILQFIVKHHKLTL